MPDEVLLGRLSRCRLEDLAKVASIEPGTLCDVLYVDVALVVALYEVDRLADIEAVNLASRLLRLVVNRAQQVVKKEVGVAHEVKGGGVPVGNEVAHLLDHARAAFAGQRPVDGGGGRESNHLKLVGYADTVKLDPYVLPWIVKVGHVGVHLIGKDEKPLSLREAMIALDAVFIRRHEKAAPGDDVVKEVMGPSGGAEGVPRLAGLTPVLKRHEVNIVTMGKRGELKLVGSHIFLPYERCVSNS